MSRKDQGLPVHSGSDRTLRQILTDHPDRPWLQGVSRNIDAESTLRSLQYYNPKDCITSQVQTKMERMARISDEAQFKLMQGQRARMEYDGKMWNNPTSIVMTEPIEQRPFVCKPRVD